MKLFCSILLSAMFMSFAFSGIEKDNARKFSAEFDQKGNQVSLDNFPEELIGFWSCNCEKDKNAESGAETPPGFWIKKRSEGYEVWYQRSSGIITEIKRSKNIFILKYEDEFEGDEIVIEIELNNDRLTIDGGGICEGWGSSGMEKCKLKDF